MKQNVSVWVALGKDISDVDKERWESEPENIQYGLDYIKTLQNSDDIEKVITVCNELLLYDQYNKHILKLITVCSLDLCRF